MLHSTTRAPLFEARAVLSLGPSRRKPLETSVVRQLQLSSSSPQTFTIHCFRPSCFPLSASTSAYTSAPSVPRPCPSAPRPCPSAVYSSAFSAEPLIRVTNLPAASSGHIRVLELNHPKARNAISRALLAALAAEVDRVHAQYGRDARELGPTRALVLASAVDSCFCAGADIKERRAFTQHETADFLANLRATFTSLADLPVPTISAISSLALGGGLELALATHFRVLSSNATISLPESRLAIIPGAGSTHRLPALVGLSRARDLILTGRRVAAPEAYFLGIADRLVEVVPEQPGADGQRDESSGVLPAARKAALEEAVRLAQDICEGGPVAVRAALQAVAWARPEKEDEMYQRVVDTEDRNEAEGFPRQEEPRLQGPLNAQP